MATRYVPTPAGIKEDGFPTEAYFAGPAMKDDPTVAIPKWLMVLAARGDVTLRIAVGLEDDPIDGLDDTATDRD